jgi:FO synthase subunit 2
MVENLHSLVRDVRTGHRLTEKEAFGLMTATGRDVLAIAAAADEIREEKCRDDVTYVRNQNLHVTNICKNLCGFCGFGRRAGDEGAYCNDKAAIQQKARLAAGRGVTEICLLSAVHTDFTLQSYLDLLEWVREVVPHVHLHAFSPDEISYAAERSAVPTRDVLEQLKGAGLGSLQGTAAEILVDTVRAVICPKKVGYGRMGPDHLRGAPPRYSQHGDNHVRIVRIGSRSG